MKTKKIKVKIRIPKKFIEPAIKKVRKFIGIDHIGKVYLAGDWLGNEWGHSGRRAGCVDPNKTTKMILEGNFYVAEIEATVGLRGFKPVVVKAATEEDGMASCIWIAYPLKEKVTPYFCEKEDIHRNWLLEVQEIS